VGSNGVTDLRGERVTIDLTVARDYTECRERSVFAEALIDLARRGVVSIAVAASGCNYDLTDPHGSVAEQLRKLIADEGIEVGLQLSYPGLHTYPGRTLVPGASVPGFPQAWSKMVASWSGRGPPGDNDRLHVETHLLHGRDVFITDDGPLLKMCERLREECWWEIDAVGIADYVGRYGLP
jgi:hypothetical protein